jgi:hypothetical protein
MGGSPNIQQQDDTKMIAFMEKQREDQLKAQADAKLAEDRAIYNASSTSADQAALASRQNAEQMLGLQNFGQQARDASATSAYQRQSGLAGLSATGGGYNMNDARQMQNANLGAASQLPFVPANYADVLRGINPANTTAAGANSLSKTYSNNSPVKFGGV